MLEEGSVASTDTREREQTCEALGLVICGHHVNHALQKWAEGKDDHIKHLTPSTADQTRPEDAVCPSQNELVQFPCVEASEFHSWTVKHEPTLIVAPKALIEVWTGEFLKFVNPRDLRHIEKKEESLYIGHISHNHDKSMPHLAVDLCLHAIESLQSLTSKTRTT